MLYSENFEYIIVDKDEEFDKQFLLGESETIKLSSLDGIYDIRVCNLYCDKKGKLKRRRLDAQYEDNIQHSLKLNKNEPIIYACRSFMRNATVSNRNCEI